MHLSPAIHLLERTRASLYVSLSMTQVLAPAVAIRPTVTPCLAQACAAALLPPDGPGQLVTLPQASGVANGSDCLLRKVARRQQCQPCMQYISAMSCQMLMR